MFNNPFDSFHKTVGKAKKEREQLDRLLTISTPGELALVSVTGAVLLLFVAWLFFGSVARSITVDGHLLEPDGNSLQSPHLQAAVWLERDLAGQIRPDMPASLQAALPNGEARTFEGRVTAIADVPLPGGWKAYESTARFSMHIVHFTRDEGRDLALPEGSECRIVIELATQSPLAFFTQGQS